MQWKNTMQKGLRVLHGLTNDTSRGYVENKDDE